MVPSILEVTGNPLTKGVAIQCAALKDDGMSYVEITERLHLPVTRPYSSRQSDVTVNLVQRGRKLLGELP